MQEFPLAPRHGGRWKQRQTGAGQSTHHCLTCHLKPVRTGLFVVHHQVRHVEGAGIAKAQHVIAEFPAKDHAAEAKRAIGDQNRNSVNIVIYYLVKFENVHRISVSPALGAVSNHQIIIVQPGQIGGRPVDWVVYGLESIPKLVNEIVGGHIQGDEPGIAPERVEQNVHQRNRVQAPVQHRHGLRWSKPS